MVFWMGALRKAADVSKHMTSHCRLMDFKSNVLNEIGDGIDARVSIWGCRGHLHPSTVGRKPGDINLKTFIWKTTA